MKTKQINYALIGLEDRIKKIAEAYQKEVKWNHIESTLRGLGLKKHDL